MSNNANMQQQQQHLPLHCLGQRRPPAAIFEAMEAQQAPEVAAWWCVVQQR